MVGALGTVGVVETFLVRVWLPDRPGALGHVASRIGALRGDVVGIDILERGGGFAVDELVVTLPDDGLLDLLVAEIVQVDGVAVEDVRRVATGRPDAGIAALEAAAALVDAADEDRLVLLCERLSDLLDADWTAAVDAASATVVATAGLTAGVVPPEAAWLAAFLDGSRHLDAAGQSAGAPGDLAWGWLGADPVGGAELVVVVGRSGRPFHDRERRQTELLCRTTAALLGTTAAPAAAVVEEVAGAEGVPAA